MVSQHSKPLRKDRRLMYLPVQYWTSALLGCYSGALLVSSPICGWLADRSSSRRMPFILGLIALGGSTILLCLGSSILILIFGRLLEGLSTAVTWTSGLALLVDTVGQEEIGKIMGWCSISTNAAMLLGPLLGGTVFERSGYYAVFTMAFGVIFLDAVLRLVVVEKKIAAQWFCVTVAKKRYTIRLCDIVAKERYWIKLYNAAGTPHITSSSQIEPISSMGFLEMTGTHDSDTSVTDHQGTSLRNIRFCSICNLPPVITLLRSTRLLVALWGSLVQAAIFCAFDSVLSLFVHRTFGWNSSGAGMIFLPIVIPSLTAPLVRQMADKYGSKWLAAVGFISALPFIVLLRLITHYSIRQVILLCTLLTLLGSSMNLAMIPLMADITYVIEAKEKKSPGMFGKGQAYVQAYRLYFFSFAGGAIIGSIWAGFIIHRVGWGAMTWSLGLLSGLAAVPILISNIGRFDNEEESQSSG
jgi:MFS family permease